VQLRANPFFLQSLGFNPTKPLLHTKSRHPETSGDWGLRSLSLAPRVKGCSADPQESCRLRPADQRCFHCQLEQSYPVKHDYPEVESLGC